MEFIFLPLILIGLKFVLTGLVSSSWSFFDPLLGYLIVFTFFHSLESRAFIFYTLLFGLFRDFFSLGGFGIYFFSYTTSVLLCAMLARLLNRDNWLFCLPMVFLGVLWSNFFAAFLRPFMGGLAINAGGEPGWFFLKTIVEALGTTALATGLILLSKKCGLKLTN